ncbi:competence type IV pilus assembly protein ComGB [Marinilactibacillus psychrotolerans]|uniref:competence type IV pilus assembly protein ComGB n=1 Tax=Marinilactibacillus psychrotolerans TaxID=191770 RepID=UPI0039AFA3B5
MGTFQKKLTNNIIYRSQKETREQGLFLKRMGTLLSEGFSLKDALRFLLKIADEKQAVWLKTIEKEVNNGESLYQGLRLVGFTDIVCTQIYLSTVHGKFSETIFMVGEQLIESAKRKKKIQSIIQYPLMLLIFIIIMLFSMRYILLPHINRIASPEETSIGIGTKLIIGIVQTAPYWILGTILLIIAAFFAVTSMTNKKTAIEKLNFYSKNKVIRPYLQLYWTYFFTLEWSQLLKNDCTLIQIVHLMQEDKSSSLFREVGKVIEQNMRKGCTFQEAISNLDFLKPEVKEIMIHGELSGRLGIELMLYSSDCEEELNQKIERIIERIQPVVFIFVALMIIAIYAALLLPTFSIMKGL